MDAHTVAGLLYDATRQLAGAEARAEAELLLAGALGRDRGWLYAHADESLDEAQRSRFQAWVARRCRGEPVAHLLGHREFWSLSLQVTADTLVPRADTERLVELALERVAPDSDMEILDLGTGSGAIALALARERPRASIVAVDRDARALDVARRNAARLGLDRVSFLQGDWFSPVRGRRFDLVVSNPPYLAADDPHLGEGDLRFEPRDALVSGLDGLDSIRRIVADAPGHLGPNGLLLMEHGWTQAAAVRALLERRGFDEVATWGDLEGRDRVSGARFAG